MGTLISDEIRAWIGRSDVPQTIEITRRDIIKYAVATEQRLAKYLAGDEAPPMFLFGVHNPATLPSLLGEDGLLPDPLLPDLPLKRVMAGGISQQHTRPVRPGDVVVITRRIADIYEKKAESTAEKLPIILEPMILLVIGGLVGTIAFAIITPIYSVVGNVGR